nr:tetratricopeptide repeat protein [Acidobacteriota bacterium]
MIRHLYSLGAQCLRPAGFVMKIIWKRVGRATNARRQGCTALPGLTHALFLSGIGFGLFVTLALISPMQQSAGARLHPVPSKPIVSSAVTSQDTQASAANQLLVEAEKLRTAGTVDSRRAAIEKYKAAMTLWQSLGERGKEAIARHSLCSTHNALGERQIALDYCEQALTVRRELSDQRGEAETLNVMGNIQLALHGPQSALDYFQSALALRRAIGDQRGIGVTLGNLARLYAQMGDSEKEREVLREALPLSQTIGDKTLENNFLYMLGNLHNNLGELEAAFSYLRQSLALSRERNDKANEAVTLSNLGRLYFEIGEKQQALSLLTDAVTLHRLNENRAAEGATLTAVAALWLSMGEADKALHSGEESLKLARESGSGEYEFYALQALGDVCRTLGDDQKALEYKKAGLSLARARGSKSEEALALSSIAIDWLHLNEPSKALEDQSQAIALHRESSNQTQLISALLTLCGIQIKLGNHAAATTACRESLTHSLNRKDRESQASALMQLAQIAIHQDALAQARGLLEEALQLIEATATEIVSHQNRASYLGFKYKLYADYIELLMRQHQSSKSAGFDKQAFRMVERARARTLLALLTEAQAGIRQGVDAVLLEREKELLRRLRIKAAEQSRLNSASSNQPRISAIAREVDELSTELEQVRARIKTSNPGYAALTQPQPSGLDEIQEKVVTDADTLLLEYALGEDQSFLWTISANSFNSYELPKGKVIEQAAQRTYDLLTARNQIVRFETDEEKLARIKQADADFQTAAAELSRMILSPAAAELRGKRPKQLLIVADGKLQ